MQRRHKDDDGNSDGRRNDDSNGKGSNDWRNSVGNGRRNGDTTGRRDSNNNGNGSNSQRDGVGDGQCNGNAMVMTATAMEGARTTGTATAVMVGVLVMVTEGAAATRRQ